MSFVEVVASGVPEERKRLICEQSVVTVIEGHGVPDRRVARVISWLGWQEVSAWSIGGQPVSPTEAPNYQVGIPVPPGWLTEQRMPRSSASPPLYSPPRMINQSGTPKPVAWVQVIDIAEGAWGALGRPVRFPEITDYVTTGAHAPASNQPMLRKRPIKEAPKCP